MDSALGLADPTPDDIHGDRANGVIPGCRSDQLAALGYIMPGEERLGSAAGLKEVRYFHEEDKERALGLIRDLNQILLDSGYVAQVTEMPLTNFKGAKPRLGTLELWLEPIRRN